MINRSSLHRPLAPNRQPPFKLQSFCSAAWLAVILLLDVGCGKPSQQIADHQTPQATQPTVSASESAESSLDESAEAAAMPVPETAPLNTAGEETRNRSDIAPQPPVNPIALYEQALDAMESGQLEQAFDWVRTAKSHAPDDPDITFLMARVLAERNRFAEAIKLLDDLSAELPDARLPILGQTADWLVLHGHWQEAEDRYRALLNEVPDASMAQRALAQLMIRQGRRLEAAAYLQQLCREGVVDPASLKTLLRLCYPFADEVTDDESEPITALGRARAALADENWDQALEALQDADDESRVIEALQGRIYAERNDFAALASWVDSCKTPIDDAADYWFASGVHHAQQAQYRDAVTAFSQAALLDPTDHQVYQRMQPMLTALQWNASLEEARQRTERIEQTYQIAQHFGTNQQPDPDQISKLAKLLRELHRPFESLAWRTVEVSLRHAKGELSAEQAAQSIAEINDQRLQLLSGAELDPQVISGKFVPDDDK